MTEKYSAILDGQPKPTMEQAAWVLAHYNDHCQEGGTYRHLIYGRLGYDMESYVLMQVAGVLDLSNVANAVSDNEEIKKNFYGSPKAMSEIDWDGNIKRLTEAFKNKEESK